MLLTRREAADFDTAAGGQQSRPHFQRRGFTCFILDEAAHSFAGCNAAGDVCDGVDALIVPMQAVAQRAADAWCGDANLARTRERPGIDDAHR